MNQNGNKINITDQSNFDESTIHRNEFKSMHENEKENETKLPNGTKNNQGVNKQNQRNLPEQMPHDHQNDESLQQYKKRLLIIVISVFVLCLLIIIQRIFYEVIATDETTVLSRFQSSSNLVSTQPYTDGEGGTIELPVFSKNWFYEFLGYLDVYRVNFMIYTHLFLTVYVAVDALVAIQTMYVTLVGYFMISIIQLIYAGPRPFWTSNEVASPVCLSTYNHPSRSTFILLLYVFYSLFCFQNAGLKNAVSVMFESTINNSEQKHRRRIHIYRIIGASMTILLTFLQYMIGLQFLINIALAVLYFVLFYFSLQFMDNYTDTIIRKSSIQSIDAQKYVFYWFGYLLLAQVFATMIFVGANDYMKIEWIQNYIDCSYVTKLNTSQLPFNELVGPWYTYVQTTCVFALFGALFGVSHNFRHQKHFEWFGGSLKLQVIRGVIANVLMIPSWILIVYQSDIVNQNWVRQVGINEYFINAFHFFFLYFVQFGLYPLHIYARFQLIDTDLGSSYMVLENQKRLSFLEEK